MAVGELGFEQGLENTQPTDSLVSITDNATTHAKSRGIYIMTSQSYDVYVSETTENTASGSASPAVPNWVTMASLLAGVPQPIMAMGIRKTSGAAAPSANDVFFIY